MERPRHNKLQVQQRLRRRLLPTHTDFRHAIGSVAAEEEYRRSQWSAWRRRRVGRTGLLVQRPGSALVAACSMRTRQLHLPRGPVLPAPQFALQGTRLVTGRDQIIRDVHYCGLLEQTGSAVTRENDAQVYARRWVSRRVRPPLKDWGRPRRRTHPRHFCGSLPSRIWTL